MLCLRPVRFRWAMEWMRSRGYRTLSFAEFMNGGSRNRAMLLTFDDGFEDAYTELFPISLEFQLKVTIFLVAGRIGAVNDWRSAGLSERRLLSLRQIREMVAYGVEFGSHSLSHRYLPDLNRVELQREVCESKARLESMLGKEIIAFSYPFGGHNERVVEAVREAGYQAGLNGQVGSGSDHDVFRICRAELREVDRPIDMRLKLATGKSVGQLVRSGFAKLAGPLSLQLAKAAGIEVSEASGERRMGSQ